jgi:hypothetical protein
MLSQVPSKDQLPRSPSEIGVASQFPGSDRCSIPAAQLSSTPSQIGAVSQLPNSDPCSIPAVQLPSFPSEIDEVPSRRAETREISQQTSPQAPHLILVLYPRCPAKTTILSQKPKPEIGVVSQLPSSDRCRTQKPSFQISQFRFS